MFKKILLVFFLHISLSFGEKAIYKTYVGSIPVGEIQIVIEKNKVKAFGNTHPYISWLYNYTFRFEVNGSNYILYEKENKKEKVYKNEKIYEKKPWLPLIIDFIRYGKKPKNSIYPFKIEKKENIYIIYPFKSKSVKKIILKTGSDNNFPEVIDIDGRYHIILKKVK
ncbi:hypothetical protein [Persephonella sp.]